MRSQTPALELPESQQQARGLSPINVLVGFCMGLVLGATFVGTNLSSKVPSMQTAYFKEAWEIDQREAGPVAHAILQLASPYLTGKQEQDFGEHLRRLDENESAETKSYSALASEIALIALYGTDSNATSLTSSLAQGDQQEQKLVGRKRLIAELHLAYTAVAVHRSLSETKMSDKVLLQSYDQLNQAKKILLPLLTVCSERHAPGTAH